jgi:hypothetical protein
MNCDLKIKEINLETFILTGQIFDKVIINNLINFCKNNNDKNLYYKTNVKGNFTGFHSLQDNNDFISFLKLIQPQIQLIQKDNFIIQSAWGNFCKKNEEVTEHNHAGINGFCGILYLSEKGPGTYFKDYDILIDEKIGKFILFHPILMHSVKKIEDDIERITVAFNMQTVKPWDELNNAIWVNKK